MTPARILIVEDDAVQAKSLQRTLSELGYEIAGLAATGEEAVALARASSPNVVLMDIRLRDEMNGIQAAAEIHKTLDVPIIYLTAYADEALVAQARMTEPYAYLAKPVRDHELWACIEVALHKSKADRQIKHLNGVLRVIRQVNQLITRETNREHLLNQACECMVQTRGYQLAWICEKHDPRRCRGTETWASQDADLLNMLLSAKGKGPMALCPCTMAFESRQPTVFRDLATDPAFELWQEAVSARGLAAAMAVPMIHEDRLYGVLCVVADQPGLFEPEEIELLQQLTGDLAYALHGIELEARRLQAEEALRLNEERLENLNKTLEQQVAERTALAEQRARQLRALAVQLSETEDRERRRLAEILHDDLQQLLAGAQMHLSALAHGLEGQGELQQRAARVGKLLDQSLQRARDLSHQLSPPTLHQTGFIHALDWLARQMQEQHHLHVVVEADKDAEPQTAPGRSFLFKAVQELLYNVVKHAGTHRALVRAGRREGQIVIEVSDQGRGFDPRKASSGPGADAGFGLFNIQQRIEQMGGTLQVQTAAGTGSRFVLTLADEGSAGPQSPETERGTGVSRRESDVAASPNGFPEEGIRLLLVDDHEVMREGLASLLAYENDLTVIGQASNGREAVDLAGGLHPDVILMDISMPVMDGIEATRQIKSSFPEIRVIGLSMHDRADMAKKIREAGAEAYLCKDGRSEDLLATIRKRT